MSVPTPSVRNITRVYRAASAEHKLAGVAWYNESHTFAEMLAEAYGVTVSTAAGVIAAVSPLNSWGNNKKLAARIVSEGGTARGGYLTLGMDKANAILTGGDPMVILKGEKITAFYLGILTRGETDAVCVDRHAWSLAVSVRYANGTIPGLKGERYAAASDAYRRAASIITRETGTPISAAQIQAVTWLAWRARYWSAGAFDGAESVPNTPELVNA